MAVSQKKILIAEDEKPLARALTLKFENEGFKVEVANDGLLVQEKIAGSTYDLILMDLMMPHHDGFSLLKDLQDRNVKTPVVVLSSLGQDEDKARAKKAGASEYFVKSNVKLSDVVNYVKSVIEKNK